MRMKETKDDLILSDSRWLLALFFLLSSGVMGLHAFADLHQEVIDWSNVSLSLGSPVLMIMATILSFESTIFAFSKQSKSLDWSKIRLLRQKQGVIPFSEIKSVIVQHKRNGTAVAFRVAIVTEETTLSIVESYEPNLHRHFAIAEKIAETANLDLAILKTEKTEALKVQADLFLKSGQEKKALDFLKKNCPVGEAEPMLAELKSRH